MSLCGDVYAYFLKTVQKFNTENEIKKQDVLLQASVQMLLWSFTERLNILLFISVRVTIFSMLLKSKYIHHVGDRQLFT